MCRQVFARLKDAVASIVSKHGLAKDELVVAARPLSPDEVIGNPEHDDYPLFMGRERMMEAVVRGARGQAFTDMFGKWEGTVGECLDMALANNFRRAIFVATLNAAMRFVGEADGTVHCKNDEPLDCAARLKVFVEEEKLEPPFLLVGYQPRLAEALHSLGETRITDMDVRHIGAERAGTVVLSPDEMEGGMTGAKTVFVTGSALVNATIEPFMDLAAPTIFYGVTIAGATKILGLRHYCPLGK